MQKTLDFSALMGGVGMLPAMLPFAIVSPLSGRLYQALGARTLAGVNATGAAFVPGLHAVYWFCAAVAAVGIVNARLVRTKDVRMQPA